MSLIAWLIVGLIAGWLASMVVNRRGEGAILDILLGVVGAFVGGYLFRYFGHAGVNGINLHSILVAGVGAILVLVIYHAIFRRRVF
ncbi:MAG: GlsB/YeaQ/YmgE family stress response membrane protein [Alphaproteobacteria bacterium]|nr:GlsB/YeaQ/YmgE family stress response membrane protein [Alphaproteobacteria bacterium]